MWEVANVLEDVAPDPVGQVVSLLAEFEVNVIFGAECISVLSPHMALNWASPDAGALNVYVDVWAGVTTHLHLAPIDEVDDVDSTEPALTAKAWARPVVLVIVTWYVWHGVYCVMLLAKDIEQTFVDELNDATPYKYIPSCLCTSVMNDKS